MPATNIVPFTYVLMFKPDGSEFSGPQRMLPEYVARGWELVAMLTTEQMWERLSRVARA